MKKVYLKNLGCPKNEVDGGILLNLIEQKGNRRTDNPEEADIIIVNSCGFIDAAKEESINEIMDLAVIKNKRNAKLVLAGCLAQRYKHIVEKEMPEVDMVVGIANLSNARDKILGLDKGKSTDTILTKKYREYKVISEKYDRPYAYLKISDGCDNFCSYCAIPLIRGRHRSRRISDIVNEARAMADHGVRELIIVAQDITQYGLDLYAERRLAKLLEKLEKIDGISWIRLLYTHPAHYYPELIDHLATGGKVVPYLDMPLQHISDKMLKKMNRRISSNRIKKLIEELRGRIDNVVLRTTYIIGFPGESDDDFGQLWQFQKDFAIERVGVFPYSHEEDTKAYKMGPVVPQEAVSKRIDTLMTLVMDQSLERNSTLLGKNIEVIIDELSKDGYFIARRYDQTPEIDGFVRAFGDFETGRFYNLKVTGIEAYDLDAESWKE